MLGAAASGYDGLPPLTVLRGFSAWTLDPWSLAGVLLLGGLYLAGMMAMRRSGREWPARRAVSFCGLGLGFAAVATMSSIGVYQPVVFYMRSVQTVLFVLLIPLFLALGRPLTLIIETVPWFGPRLKLAITSRAARLALFPAITAFVLVLTPFLVYFTPWYEAGFRSGLVAQITPIALAVPGFVFFWTLLRLDPVPKAYPYVTALWVSAAEVIGDALLGLAVIADTNLIAGSYYRALGSPWNIGLPTKQVLGGGVLWVLGDVVGLPFLAAQLIQMIREDESEAKVIDAELDAADAGAAAVAGTSAGAGAAAGAVAAPAAAPGAGQLTSGSDAPGGPQSQRPWWESDQRFTGRFRAVDEPDQR